MNKKILVLLLTFLCVGLISCSKIEDNKTDKGNTNTSEETEVDKVLDNISNELKGVEISQDDITFKDTTQMNKINSERYQGEVSQKDAPHGNKIEIGIVTNKDSGEKYTFSDLFNITDEFVTLVINSSNNQLDDISKQFTNNFDNDEWKIRLENVSKDDSLSYFVFNSSQQLEIYFDVPPAYGSYMKVVTLEKSEWINFVKDESLF